MKQHVTSLFLRIALIFTLLTGCSTSTQGPTIWLDDPLDGESYPLQPLTFQAHASDGDGVTKIEFYVEAKKIADVPASGNRFGEASYEWLPPASGAYIVSARAVDNKGELGNMTSVKINIGKSVETIAPTGSVVLAPQVNVLNVECGPGLRVTFDVHVNSPQGIMSIEVFSTWVAATTANMMIYSAPYPFTTQVNFWLEEPYPDTIDRPHQVGVKAIMVGLPSPVFGYGFEPGTDQRCPGHYEEQAELTLTPIATVVWIANQDTNCRSGPGTIFSVVDYIMSGGQVPVEGKNEDDSWFLVRKPDASLSCWVSIGTGKVEGDLSKVPEVSVPTPTSTGTSPPPIDAMEPDISGASIDPVSITVEGSECPSNPRMTIISASVTDNAAVGRVVARILGYGEVEMVAVGGNVYQATLGPFSETGSYSILIIATDGSGNSNQYGPLTLTVDPCIG
jgi:hypothetical protein